MAGDAYRRLQALVLLVLPTLITACAALTPLYDGVKELEQPTGLLASKRADAVRKRLRPSTSYL